MTIESCNKGRASRLIMLAVAASLAGPSLVLAQGSPAEADSDDGVLAEVIVTATRRSESVLEVPISIAALDAESLIKSNIKSFEDLSTIVPSVSFESSPSLQPSQNLISIRGVVSASGDPTTGLYLDDVAITQQGNANFGSPLPAMFDLDRIEVLRGPQGTLFGAGAMGGAVRFIQNQPGLDRYTGRATAQLGFIEDGGTTYEAGAAYGGPIIEDKLGFRVSAWQRRDGGYVDRFDPISGQIADEDANRIRTTAARAALTWAPSDWLKITPAIYWQKEHSPNPGHYHPPVSNADEGEFNNASYLGLPLDSRFYIPSLTVQANLGFADLTAVSSYLNRESSSEGDISASFGARVPIFVPFVPADGFGNPLGYGFVSTPDQFMFQKNTYNGHTLSQELRLSSSDREARLAWTAGVFYQDTSQIVRDRWDQGTPFQWFSYDGADTSVQQKQLSGFAQLDWRVIDRLTLTAGARISRVEVDLHVITYNCGVPVPGRTTPQSVCPTGPFAPSAPMTDIVANTVDKPVNPKFGVEYQFTPQNLVYLSAGKGFRAGGANAPLPQTVLCPNPPDNPYGPDSVWSYEIGTKNRLFGDRATFVASAYRVKWADIQSGIALTTVCGGIPVVNAGTATVDGFDAGLSVAIVPSLRGDLSFAYNDAKYTSTIVDSNSGNSIALDGYSLSAAAAPWSATAALEYSFPLRGHEAFFRVEDTYRAGAQGPFLFENAGNQSFNPDLRGDPGYNVLNVRSGVTVNGLQVALFVKNATNASPTLNWDNRVETGEFVYAHTIVPRSIGIDLNYSF